MPSRELDVRVHCPYRFVEERRLISPPTSARIRIAAAKDLAAVLAIHKRLKRWLGHLPDQVFAEAIEDGRLMVAERGGMPVGYVVYRERDLDAAIVIVHLAVDPEAQTQGIGTELVDSLVRAVPDRRRIVVRCRRDFPAHGFWSRAGFAAVSEGVGRSADGKPLTTFERRLRAEPTLFDALFEPSKPFAVDLDVLLDLVTKRPQGAITRQVFVQLDQFDTHPLKTRSLLNELNQQRDAALRRKARALMDGWAFAKAHASAAYLRALKSSIPAAEESDLLHLADAAANEVDVLLTRDVAFQRAVAGAPARATGVEVVEPATFIDRLMRGESPEYEPKAVAGMRNVAASDCEPVPLIADAFVCHEAGERKGALRGRLQSLLASESTEVACLVRDSGVVGLYSMTSRGNLIECGLLRVGRGHDATTVAQHALAHLRRVAVSRGCEGVLVSDPVVTRWVEHGLRAEGYEAIADGWASVALPPSITRRVVSDRIASLRGDGCLGNLVVGLLETLEASARSPLAAAELEKALDPLVVVDAVLPAVVVPIQARWSDRLLGVTPSQLDLDTTDADLRAYREHVYFRSPHGVTIRSPSRVFWYRTLESPSRLFATSVIDKVVVAGFREVWGRFGGYGVLDRGDVRSRVDRSGRTMVLRFVRTRRLRREVTLQELRGVATSLSLPEPATPLGPRTLDRQLGMWLLGDSVGVE